MTQNYQLEYIITRKMLELQGYWRIQNYFLDKMDLKIKWLPN